MENESLSLQDEGEQSGDVIMSDNDIDPNYEPSEDGIAIFYSIIIFRGDQIRHLPWDGP